LLHALVTPADVQDRDGGLMLLATLFGQFPFLKKLFADSAYAGPVFHDGLANIMPNLVTEIVRRSDRAKGFVVLPKRWIVERTIGWLGRCRRLAKDWENLNHNALAFIRLASIRLMVTGAKPRAKVENLLAATRGGLIQAGCDCLSRDSWRVERRAAAACVEAAGRERRPEARDR
jgi:transposase